MKEVFGKSILIVGGTTKSRSQKALELTSLMGLAFSENDPDFLSLEPIGLSIGVEQIKTMVSWLNLHPLRRKQKLAIIANAEALTHQAQNALLKTLEEPPGESVIILEAPSSVFFLPTVLSRCQIVEIPFENPAPLTSDESRDLLTVIDWIKSKNIHEGFAWAQAQSKDRKTAISIIDKLILMESTSLNSETVKSLLTTKKFLLANTNVRLTLENLFLN